VFGSILLLEVVMSSSFCPNARCKPPLIRPLATAAAASLTLLTAPVNAQVSADPTFGIGGARFASTGQWQHAAIQPDGSVVVVGTRGRDFLVARFLADGTPDASFGSGGATTVDFAGRFDIARAVFVKPDGRILVAGTSMGELTRPLFNGLPAPGRYDDVGLVRLLPNGAVDPTFGINGRVLADFSAGFSDQAIHVYALPTGDIRVVGSVQAEIQRRWAVDLAVFGFTSGGAVDPAFGNGGAALVDVGAPVGTFRSVIAADAAVVGSSLLIAGTYGGAPLQGMPGTQALAIARVDAVTGAQDLQFGVAGVRLVGFAPPPGSAPGDAQTINANTLAPQPDGSVIVGGFGEVFIAADDITDGVPRPFAVRLSASGQLDPAFSAFPNGRGGGLAGGAVFGVAGGNTVVQIGGRLYPVGASGALGAAYGPLMPSIRRFVAQGTRLLGLGTAGPEYVIGTETSLSRYAIDGSIAPPAPPAQVGFQLPPRAPGSFFVSSIGSTSARFTWADLSSNEQSFELELSISPWFTNPVRIALPPNTTAFTDAGLQRSTTYHYRLSAVNPAGASPVPTGPLTVTTRRR
jgi:uncharacterized delta-60 repeat protein